MSDFSKKYKDKLDLSYKYGKLYAINLKIDTEEKDLDKFKHDRADIYKELSELDKKN